MYARNTALSSSKRFVRLQFVFVEFIIVTHEILKCTWCHSPFNPHFTNYCCLQNLKIVTDLFVQMNLKRQRHFIHYPRMKSSLDHVFERYCSARERTTPEMLNVLSGHHFYYRPLPGSLAILGTRTQRSVRLGTFSECRKSQ